MIGLNLLIIVAVLIIAYLVLQRFLKLAINELYLVIYKAVFTAIIDASKIVDHTHGNSDDEGKP